jgi:hypothetical protein
MFSTQDRIKGLDDELRTAIRNEGERQLARLSSLVFPGTQGGPLTVSGSQRRAVAAA